MSDYRSSKFNPFEAQDLVVVITNLMSIIYVLYTVRYGIDPYVKQDSWFLLWDKDQVTLCVVDVSLSFCYLCLKPGCIQGDKLIGKNSGLTHFLLNVGQGPKPPISHAGATDRVRTVLIGLCEGISAQEIAIRKLYISQISWSCQIQSVFAHLILSKTSWEGQVNVSIGEMRNLTLPKAQKGSEVCSEALKSPSPALVPTGGSNGVSGCHEASRSGSMTPGTREQTKGRWQCDSPFPLNPSGAGAVPVNVIRGSRQRENKYHIPLFPCLN